MALKGDAVKESGVFLALRDWEAVPGPVSGCRAGWNRGKPDSTTCIEGSLTQQSSTSSVVWLSFYKSGWINFWGFVSLIIFHVIAKEQLSHSLVIRLGHLLKPHSTLAGQLSDIAVHIMKNYIQQEKLPLPNTNHIMWNIVHINKQSSNSEAQNLN